MSKYILKILRVFGVYDDTEDIIPNLSSGSE